jgi:hypothetical protein
MSEIYEGESTVRFVIPNSATITSATAYQKLYDQTGVLEETPTVLTYTSAQLSESPTDKEVLVNVTPVSSFPVEFWVNLVYNDGSAKTKREQFQVVTPYVSVEEIVAAGGLDMYDHTMPNYRSPEQVREMEALARKVIEAYTGRRFYHEYLSIRVEGTNLTELFFPREIQSVDLVLHDVTEEVIYSETTGSYVVSPSGHLLVVEDDSGDRYGFPEGYHYTAIGIFGYESVPYDIQLAAKQLAVHYLCNDAAGANNYIDQFKFGESQTRTHRLAFIGTGLRSVDLLLDPYRFDHYVVL